VPSFLPSFYMVYQPDIRSVRSGEDLSGYVLPTFSIEPTEYLPKSCFPDYDVEREPYDDRFGNVCGLIPCPIYTGFTSHDAPRTERVLSYRVLSPQSARLLTYGAEMTQSYRYMYELKFLRRPVSERAWLYFYADFFDYDASSFGARAVYQRMAFNEASDRALPSTWLSRNGRHPGVGLSGRYYKRLSRRLRAHMIRFRTDTVLYLLMYHDARRDGYIPSNTKIVLCSPNVEAGSLKGLLPNPIRVLTNYFRGDKTKG